MGAVGSVVSFFKDAFSGKDVTRENAKQLNPNYETFSKLAMDQEELRRKSVLEEYLENEKKADSLYGFVGYDQTSYSEFVYGAVSTSKGQRLLDYRRMAAFPEISDALDEICDAMLNRDDEGEIATLKIKNTTINKIKETEINDAFDYFINLFKLDYKFYEYSKTLCTDGELAFENIIDQNKKENGLIGVNLIPNEAYEFLIDDKMNKKGLFVFTNTDFDNYSMGALSPQGGVKLFDNKNNQNNSKNAAYYMDTNDAGIEVNCRKGIPLPWEQVTYIDSGNYSSSGLIVYPILEKARKAYRQLSLIEDALIIYRLVRAPERLVFNIDTGKLPRAKAEQEVLKMMKRYNTRQFYNPVTGSVSNSYDPTQILESMFFAKPEGSTGTNVTTIGGSGNVNFSELPDLDYFVKKLYISLKVPFNRYKDPTVKIEKADTINYEELRFAKFIMRVQERFAIGLMKSFIVHLKLTGMWEQYELQESDLQISITPPATYDLYESQRLLKIKIENYDLYTKEHPEFSKELAMKTYLNFTDKDIEVNNERLQKEMLFRSMLERTGEAIKATGNPYKTE